MLDWVIGLFGTSFNAVVGWFDSILGATQIGALYIFCFAMLLVYKFILSPIFGKASGSDRASKKRAFE